MVRASKQVHNNAHVCLRPLSCDLQDDPFSYPSRRSRRDIQSAKNERGVKPAPPIQLASREVEKQTKPLPPLM